MTFRQCQRHSLRRVVARDAVPQRDAGLGNRTLRKKIAALGVLALGAALIVWLSLPRVRPSLPQQSCAPRFRSSAEAPTALRPSGARDFASVRDCLLAKACGPETVCGLAAVMRPAWRPSAAWRATGALRNRPASQILVAKGVPLRRGWGGRGGGRLSSTCSRQERAWLRDRAELLARALPPPLWLGSRLRAGRALRLEVAGGERLRIRCVRDRPGLPAWPPGVRRDEGRGSEHLSAGR